MISAADRFVLVEGWEQLPETMAHADVAGAAVGPDDRVYALTRSENRVMVYAPDGSFLDAWGEAELTRPHMLSLGPDALVYVADDRAHMIRVFTPGGRPVRVIGDGRPSETGVDMDAPTFFDRCASIRAGGPFNTPTKAAAAADGEVYVSDGYGNSRVHRFDGDGRLLASWGETGTGPGEFHVPHSVAIHPDGRLFVTDRENDRIQLFDREGRFLEAWTQVRRPTDVAFDGDGFVFVTELPRLAGNLGRDRSFTNGLTEVDLPGRVSILSPEGSVVMRLGEGDPCGEGGFAAPHSIAIDSKGDVYVAEVVAAFGAPAQASCARLKKFRRVRAGVLS
jgi:DNA-binding beta-propeller fold protein YncE